MKWLSWLPENLWAPVATLVAIPLTFVLITVFGGIISHKLQKNIYVFQKKRESTERLFQERKEVFDILSRILDRRIYQFRQVIYGWWRKDDAWVDREFEELRKIVFEWNGQINSLYGKVQVYFGLAARNQLESDVGSKMRRVQRLLEQRKRGNADALAPSAIFDEIDVVNAAAESLYRYMLKVIEDDAFVIDGKRPRRKR